MPDTTDDTVEITETAGKTVLVSVSVTGYLVDV